MIKLLFLFLFPLMVEARQIRIAVIDTGFHPSKIGQVNLCPKGHKDFTGTGIQDTNGHGTHVSGLINKNAQNADYCQLIFKFWSKEKEDKNDGFGPTILAFKEAMKDKVDIINYSAGGEYYSHSEALVIKQVLDSGIVIVAAAGNNRQNLDRHCHFFPACYDKRIIVAGNLREDGKRNPSSNYGNIVDVWVNGTNQESLGLTLTGTSMSAAIVSGRLVKIMRDKQK